MSLSSTKKWLNSNGATMTKESCKFCGNPTKQRTFRDQQVWVCQSCLNQLERMVGS